MEQLNLFYNKQDETYYCNEELKCTNCRKELFDCFQLATFWGKRESWISVFCLSCFNKVKKSGIFQMLEEKYVVVGIPPEGSIPVLIRPPSLVTTRSGVDGTVFAAAELKSRGKDINKCRLAGRPEATWEGVTIGKDITPELEEKDRPIIADQEAMEILDSLQDATPLLPTFNRREGNRLIAEPTEKKMLEG